jgi:hypothetical protein
MLRRVTGDNNPAFVNYDVVFLVEDEDECRTYDVHINTITVDSKCDVVRFSR